MFLETWIFSKPFREAQEEINKILSYKNSTYFFYKFFILFLA